MYINYDVVLLTFTLQLISYVYIILFSSVMCDYGFISMLYTPVNGTLSPDLIVFK